MKVETKVGLMFGVAIALVVIFSYLLGAFNPFGNYRTLYVAYNYAGGIDVGSPVRVMGIKVGKVKSIQFDPSQKMPDGEEVKLRLTVQISREAWDTIRTDSRFFINLAGVIGEKFLEISPGSTSNPPFEDGALIRGEDPPRIDQLISQSYGLAGKVLEFVEKNEGTVTDTINSMNGLLENFNKTLALLDKAQKDAEVRQLLVNMKQISGDIAHVTKRLRTEESDKTLDLVHRLVWRLDELDKQAIRKFLQDEGVKARMAF